MRIIMLIKQVPDTYCQTVPPINKVPKVLKVRPGVTSLNQTVKSIVR